MKGCDAILSALSVIEEGLNAAEKHGDFSLVAGCRYLIRLVALDIEGS